ncbi:MAG: hypothetical protein LBT48_04900 [Prevotellaceae bacterium]|nr:hypothetical protein [Prevotellaceae bacterium]
MPSFVSGRYRPFLEAMSKDTRSRIIRKNGTQMTPIGWIYADVVRSMIGRMVHQANLLIG